MSEIIKLQAADGHTFSAYVARPNAVPHAGVVLLQEIFGVNDHIRGVANGFAKLGYLVVAPATFDRVQTEVSLGYFPDDVALGRALKDKVEQLPLPGVMQDIQAAVSFASQAGSVGVVGFCWGGLLTWRAACMLDNLAGAVAYYGGGMTQGVEAERQALCPMMTHFGEQDKGIPIDTVKAFANTHPDVQNHIYKADHGFNCDHRGSFNLEAANMAFTRTATFFAQNL